MDILHWSDLPSIFAVVLAILLPELIESFKRRDVLFKLAITASCCIVGTIFARLLQHADPITIFVRCYLMAITTRILLANNHATDAITKAIHPPQAQEEGA